MTALRVVWRVAVVGWIVVGCYVALCLVAFLVVRVSDRRQVRRASPTPCVRQRFVDRRTADEVGGGDPIWDEFERTKR